MANVCTICLPDVAKDEAYAKTDTYKRRIMDAIKRDTPNATKNDIIVLMTAPNIIRVISFNENLRLRAKIIESSKPSDGVLFTFEDEEMYIAAKYYHDDIDGLKFCKRDENKGYMQFLGFNDNFDNIYSMTINKGAYYKFKFYIG